MNKKTVWNIVGATIVFMALLVTLTAIDNRNETVPTPLQENSSEIAVSITIDGLFTDEELTVMEDQTVLQILETLDSEDTQIRLVTKEYSGLGVLVESIGGITNGDEGKYWQYTVNGTMPQVGADAFVVTDEDRIEWLFTQSTF